MFRKRFPFFRQYDGMDCGPTCLKMIAAYYGKTYSLQTLRDKSYIDREGVSLMGISEAAEQIGMQSLAVRVPYEHQDEEEASLLQVGLPCIVHWQQRHFVVVHRIDKKNVWVADPEMGKLKLTKKTFERGWLSDGKRGIVLILEPGPDFFAGEGEQVERAGLGFLFKHLTKYRHLVIQLFIGLLLASVFQLIFPFLTQALVDIGIENQDLNFIYLILIAQLMIFVGRIMVQFIQSWILLHIGTRINVSLIADFLMKMIRLPIGFFDAKSTGDLLQRINDHDRIERFLTDSTLVTIFSFFNIIVFSIVLLIYNRLIFFIFFVSSILYVGWVMLFLKKRQEIDHQNFEHSANNRNTLIELIQGMQEIKLQNSEKKRRWQWTNIQARLFHVSMKSLRITQYQDIGAGFITQLKDILISFFAAKAVIDGQMTLGMMLAVQYIIGQLNAPLTQMINFIRSAQDAQISLDRLGEIHNKEEETEVGEQFNFLPDTGNFMIENVSFSYNPLSAPVLKNINLEIPRGKVTAIVGTSGSGKTTLVKLLLGFYPPTEGTIKLRDVNLENLNKRKWRSVCGAVMQDGFIFSDTIANNIAESDTQVDREQLLRAVKVANIEEYISSMPLGYNTMVGARGNGMSQGQRQRLLIARAVYKNPSYLFFDEATNALDARNEKTIMENMNNFFQGRTVVVVAHRLSTVKNADKIVVLENGEMIEEGTHTELVKLQGAYFGLVKNQLELGQ